MAHIVVLGAGTGGMPCAYELRAELGKEHKITVVNERDYFQFVPSNPWVAVGWRDRASITFDIRPHLERKGVDFIAQRCDKIEPENNRLVLADGANVDYDYLIIATGPKLSFGEVEGAGPDGGNTHSVCSVDHAEQAYEDYKAFLESPGQVIVGAMPFASCFGPAYEYAFILDADLRKRKMRDKVPMTFVTSEPYIGHLGLGGVGDSKGMLESEMRNHHINWVTNAKVVKVEEGKMFVEQYDDNGHKLKDLELPFKYSMMLPSFRGVDCVAAVEGLCNPRGFVFVDDHQRNPKYKNIFSAGVCIAIPPVETTASQSERKADK
jgi:sulfide:quinone oxidoreductase